MRSALMICVTLGCATTTFAADWVQWSGNGQFYAVGLAPGGITWSDARAAALAQDADLVSITSAAENAFVFSLVNDPALFIPEVGTPAGLGPWIGLWKPAAAWEWTDGNPFAYTNWAPGEPNGVGGVEFRGHYFGPNGTPTALWNDFPDNGSTFPGHETPVAWIMERGNCPGDVNGDLHADFTDLNLILENWATTVTPGTNGDLDHNGTVDFSDLNIMLGNWGEVCESSD